MKALGTRLVVNYIIHSATCEQAYSGSRNSGFSDYAYPQVRCTAEYMPGFRYILHLTLSIYLKGKAQPLLPHGAHTRWLKDAGQSVSKQRLCLHFGIQETTIKLCKNIK
jgi:hypothetical protein